MLSRHEAIIYPIKTAQNPTRFFKKDTLTQSVKAVPCYTRKKGSKPKKHCGQSAAMSRHVARAWEKESAMSFRRSAAKDHSAGYKHPLVTP